MKTITHFLRGAAAMVAATLATTVPAQQATTTAAEGYVPRGTLKSYDYTYLSKGQHLTKSASLRKDAKGEVWATYYHRTADPRIDSVTMRVPASVLRQADSLLAVQTKKKDLRGAKTRLTSTGYGQVETFHANYTSGDTLGMVGYLDSYGLAPINKLILSAIELEKHNGTITQTKPAKLDGSLWHDGKQFYTASVNGQRMELYASERDFMADRPLLVVSMPAKGAWTVASRNAKVSNRLRVKAGMRVTHEQTGDYRMLVFRDAQGAAVDILLAETPDRRQIAQALHDQLDGVYENETGTSVFGNSNFLKKGEIYSGDPGAYDIKTNKHSDLPTDTIVFGHGRISRPPMPDYIEGPDGKKTSPPPGYNGYASIAGPILWTVRLNGDGIDCHETQAAKYVDKWPDFGKDFHLRRIRNAYEDVAGIWAIASMRPLARGMLERYDKATLRLMRNEVYARHGDTFGDPELQSHFEQQEWYKPAPKGQVNLTDLERLNVALIRSVENGR